MMKPPNEALIEAMARAIQEAQTPAEQPFSAWWDWKPEARAALAAIQASGTHVVVPVEPTNEMIRAAWDLNWNEAIWKAMLEAAR